MGRQTGTEYDTPPAAIRRLRRIALAIFVIAECTMLAVNLVLALTDQFSWASFAAVTATATALLVAIVYGAHRTYTSTILRLLESERLLVTAREDLEESEARYTGLFHSSSDGILYLDWEGHILECNTAFVELLACDEDELAGRRYDELTPREWRAVDQDVFEHQLRESGHSDEYTKEFVRADGTVIPVSTRVWRVDDRDGKPLGVWVIARDISERRQYEDFIRDTIVRMEQAYDKLSQLDRQRSEFTAMVTHELKAPVATLLSGIAALRQAWAGAGSEQATLLEGLERSALRLSRLIGDMLDIASIDAGQLKLEIERADATAIVTRVAQAFGIGFAEKGLSLELKGCDGGCTGRFDEHRIEQVLTNIVDNAMRFTESGGVTIAIECRANRIVFSVTDTGPGMPPDVQTKVFQKFFTVSRGENNLTRGTGLGLAISKGIVEAHGGSIWVESGEGGTTFTFDVPRTD